jgi:chromosome segregation ATPase
MNEDFIFRLGADVSSFTKSITEVEKELDSARKAIKGALGDDLVKGNQYVEQLEQSLKDLKATGVQIPGAAKAATEIKNISPAAQKAQNTLTGLSGVVRDLPFGFIAIQNNLPILIDQFSALSKTSGGVGGALKGLGGALVGPAGAAFAFGAVVSVVTGVIQKYGSLGNAIKVLTAENAALVEAQLQFVKESTKAAGASVVEDAKVKILTQSLLDGKTARKDQIAYYEELKRISPDVVSGISEENLGTDESNRLISQNVLLRAELVRLQIQEAGIKSAASTNAEALALARNKETKATKDLANFTAEYNAVSKASGQAPQAIQGSATAIAAANSALQSAQKEISKLTVVENEFLGQLDKITPRVAQINGIFKEQNDTLAESTRKTNEAKLEGERRTKQLEREAIAIAKKSKADEKALEKLREERTIRVTAQLEVDFQRRGNIDTSEILKKRIQETQKEVQRTAGAIQVPLQFPAVNPLALLQNLKLAQAEFQKLKEAANLQAATNLISDTFFTPLAGLFEGLISGADNAFKEFTKAIFKAINQIVAKIIATGIISLLANLLFPGAGGVGVSLGKKVLGDIGAAFGFKTLANPNFGGVTGGGMAMSGAVNVVLRGQDLVGSLNRTNAQINRVG